MTQLNQIVAIEKGVKGKTQRALTDAYHTVQKTPLFAGISRTYQPKDDDGDQLPPESTRVIVKADDVLKNISEALTRLFDVTLTKEIANTEATADVKIDGKVLVKGAPVPFLLFLEKQLNDVRTFVGTLPTLDPSEVWDKDENEGVYASEPVQTTKTKKVPKVQVLYEATDKHPAQVQSYNEDVLVGTWTTRKFSGAIPATRKNELLNRVDRLIEAVKFAREEANTHEITDHQSGKAVFDYLFS